MISTSNQFKEGKQDKFQQIAGIPIAKNRFAISLKEYAAPYYKFLLKGVKNNITSEITINGTVLTK